MEAKTRAKLARAQRILDYLADNLDRCTMNGAIELLDHCKEQMQAVARETEEVTFTQIHELYIDGFIEPGTDEPVTTECVQYIGNNAEEIAIFTEGCFTVDEVGALRDDMGALVPCNAWIILIPWALVHYQVIPDDRMAEIHLHPEKTKYIITKDRGRLYHCSNMINRLWGGA